MLPTKSSLIKCCLHKKFLYKRFLFKTIPYKMFSTHIYFPYKMLSTHIQFPYKMLSTQIQFPYKMLSTHIYFPYKMLSTHIQFPYIMLTIQNVPLSMLLHKMCMSQTFPLHKTFLKKKLCKQNCFQRMLIFWQKSSLYFYNCSLTSFLTAVHEA